MKTKNVLWFVLLLAMLGIVAHAEVIITTADGNGADGGISNDDNKDENWLGGAVTVAEIRHYDTVRAKAILLRFDLGDGIGGDLSGATLTVTTTSGNRDRTMNVYGLTDGSEDFWDEATLSYNTAPGFVSGSHGYLWIDPNDNPWTLLNTMPFTAAVGDQVCDFNTEMLDFIADDTNGVVTFYLYTSTSDSSQSWYVSMKENQVDIPTLTFPNARFATNPQPANGGTVTSGLTQLCWTNVTPAEGTITCDVYIGTNEPNNLPDYGMTKITPAGGTTDTCVTIPFTLDSPGTYYWVVDSYDSGSDPQYLGMGVPWSFDVSDAPLIASQPEDQFKFETETANFFVTVGSTTTVTYTWYKSDDDAIGGDTIVGTNSSTLSISGLTGTNQAYYYCKAVNSTGEANAAYSDVVRLVVKRQVAYWTMDSADFVGGQYVDSSGEGHNADPNVNAAFVDGVNVATTNQGLLVNQNSFANAGTWDPSDVSDQFTLSFWVKWDGTGTGGFRGLLAKHNGWAAGTTLWQVGLNSSNVMSIIRAGGTNVYAQAIPADEWVYVAVTFDETDAHIYTYATQSGGVSFVEGIGAYSLGEMRDADFNIGCSFRDATGFADLFPGVMDEIQVFNYAMDAFAIADLYNEGLEGRFCLLAYGSSEFDLDINGSCVVDLPDFAEFAKRWLECGFYPNCP